MLGFIELKVCVRWSFCLFLALAFCLVELGSKQLSHTFCSSGCSLPVCGPALSETFSQTNTPLKQK